MAARQTTGARTRPIGSEGTEVAPVTSIDIDSDQLAGMLSGGMSVAFLDTLEAHGFSRSELAELVVPPRSLARRRQAGDKLSPEESDRAFRLARITALAERVFADRSKAHRWLRKPSRTLDGSTPLELLRRESGAHVVEQALHRIDFGMLA
jgi:putative toxin-antitoxin system antitoxin component (TIGR02293 family)